MPWQAWLAEKVYKDLPHLQESQGKPLSIFLLGSTHSKLPSCKLSQLICHWSKLSRKMTIGCPLPWLCPLHEPPKDSCGHCLVSCVCCSEHAQFLPGGQIRSLAVHIAEPLFHFMASICLCSYWPVSVAPLQLQRRLQRGLLVTLPCPQHCALLLMDWQGGQASKLT